MLFSLWVKTMKASQNYRPRRSTTTVLVVVTAILLLATQSLWLGESARAEGTSAVPIRFEGYVWAQGPTKWTIGNNLEGYRIVNVTGTTPIIEKQGRAQLGAWVIVRASVRGPGELDAILIEVDRPAGAIGPQAQFVGMVTKIGDQGPDGVAWWLVDDTPVQVTATTRISGTVTIGTPVWVGALMYPSGLRAEWVQALASQTAFEFRGTLQEIGREYRLIDDRRVTVTPDTVIIGTEVVGAAVECRALDSGGGALLATLIRVLPPTAEAQISGSIAAITDESNGTAAWDVVVDPQDPIGDPKIVRVKVDGNTWVDQSESVAEQGGWVEVRGTALRPDLYQAGMVRVARGPRRGALQAAPQATQMGNASIKPWSDPTTILPSQSSAEYPMVAYTTDHVTHAVWESNSRIYYANQPRGGAWTAPVMIAYGFAPHTVADSNGTLHVAFVNLFMGNYETYYVFRSAGVWSLPINMAYTTGYSAQPKLALASDNTLHAVWMDNTPGHWTTYHATWNGRFWSNRPIPSGRGQSPAINIAADGGVYVVWQDRVPRDAEGQGDFDIFVSTLRDGTWSPPLDLSDSPRAESVGPDITSTADSEMHVAWVDDELLVRYCYGQWAAWSLPQVVAGVGGYASNPHIISEGGKYLHLAWEEEGEPDQPNALWAASTNQHARSWPTAYRMVTGNSLFKEPALAVIPAGGVGLSWAEVNDVTGTSLRASVREPMREYRVWVPTILSAVEFAR